MGVLNLFRRKFFFFLSLSLFLFLGLKSSSALSLKNLPVEVIYDPGNPDNSVGIIGEELLETGVLYEEALVIGFEADAIILKEPESDDALKWLREGEISNKVRLRARRLFVVKQMRAIYEAQAQYREKVQDHYAPEIATLIDHGFLRDGFKEMEKENYTFRILQVGEAKRLGFEFKRRPFFTAVAEPLDYEQDPWFFSVDQLGQVRYSKSLEGVTWGPVWEYNTLNEEPPSTVITYKEEE